MPSALEYLDATNAPVVKRPSADEFLGPITEEDRSRRKPSAEDFLGPPPLDYLEKKFGNLDYTPTDYEIGRYLDLKKEKGLTPSEWVPKAVEAAVDLGQKAWTAAKEVPGAIADPGMGAQSVLEGGARSIRDAGDLATKALDTIVSSRFGPIGQIRRMVERPQSEKELRDAAIEKFKEDRQFNRQSARLASGAEMLVPEIFGKANPALAEGLAIIENPINYVGFGAGAAGEGANLASRIAGRTVAGAGTGIERLGQATATGLRLPQKLISGARNLVASDAELAAGQAAKLDEAIGSAASRATAAAAPEASDFITKWTDRAAKLAETAQQVGPALQAVGRNIAEPAWSAQVGVLKNVARDAAAPDWVRRWAQAATPFDPILSTAGRAGSGALHGAAVGGALGALTDGEEGAASGFGSGGIFGLAGGLAGGLSRGAREARVQADLTRWMNSLPPEAQVAMATSGLTGDQAARVMNTQRFITGLKDVDFEYLTDAQWKAKGLPPGQGMESTPGDRPKVQINIDQIGKGAPVLHETGHVLRRLMPEQFTGLDRALFSDFTVGEGTGKDFITGRTDTSGGILSPEQQQKIYDQYFSRLDPETQAKRLATMSKAEHLASLREEVSSDFLSNLLQNKKPDYLIGIGGLKSKLLGALTAHEEAAMLARIPGIDAIKETRDARGNRGYTLNGKPLNLEGRAANELKRLLGVRDRVTRQLFADVPENAGITGIVTPREIAADKSGIIAKTYGHTPTFAKDPITGQVLIDPVTKAPKINDNGTIAKLDKEQGRQIGEALRKAPAGPGDYIAAGGRQLEPMTLQANGQWSGDYFTDAHLASIARDVAKNLISPEHFRLIQAINDAIKSGQGAVKPIKYFPATKEKGQTGARRYAPLGQKGYAVSPYGFLINKEGGLSLRAFDVGSVNTKLNRWMSDARTKPRLSIWNGDRDAVWQDINKYLDNHARGLAGDLNLDPNATVAVQKRNVIADLLIGRRVNPRDPSRAIKPFLSTEAGKDNPVKTFRVDRIGDIGPNTGQNFGADYFKIKENLLPLPAPDPARGQLPPGVTPGAVMKHAQSQATYNLKTRLVSGGAPPALAEEIAGTAWKKAEKAARRQSAPSDRAYTVRAADRLNQLGPADMEAIRAATIKGGTDGAAKEIEKRLLVAPSTLPSRGQRMPVRVR